LIHAYTSIGAPHIWNGEEMGMWGADDPHPRKPLMWKEFTFKPERRNNFQPDSSDERDSVQFNQKHFDFYKKLISIRKNNSVLTSGEIEFILTEGKTLAYRRFSDTKEIFVLLNTDNTAHEFSILKPGAYTDLLTNQLVQSNKLTVGALSAMVLKRNN
jgi:glycosidase